MKWLYKITNNINDKIYIGVSVNPQTRWKAHKSPKSTFSVINSAILKYGEDNFNFEILCCGEDSYIDELEVKAIQLYNSQIPKGYNVTLGGDGASTIKWDDSWNNLLGTVSDISLANRLGISEASVARRRSAQGIPPHIESLRLNWEDHDHLLGTMTDYKLAEMLDVSASQVMYRRHELGLPSYGETSKILPKEAVDLLGKVPDREISDKFNVSFHRVYTTRHELGIEGVKGLPAHNKIQWDEDQLSFVRDTSLTTTELAEKLGLARNTVHAKRKELGIVYNRKGKAHKYHITPEMNKDLLDDNVSLKDLCDKYGFCSCTARKKRKMIKEVNNE